MFFLGIEINTNVIYWGEVVMTIITCLSTVLTLFLCGQGFILIQRIIESWLKDWHRPKSNRYLNLVDRPICLHLLTFFFCPRRWVVATASGGFAGVNAFRLISQILLDIWLRIWWHKGWNCFVLSCSCWEIYSDPSHSCQSKKQQTSGVLNHRQQTWHSWQTLYVYLSCTLQWVARPNWNCARTKAVTAKTVMTGHGSLLLI